MALDADARIYFNLLQHHRSKAQALLFYVFDVLIHRGRSLLLTSPSADKPKLARPANTILWVVIASTWSHSFGLTFESSL